jgi:hypothetical protein
MVLSRAVTESDDVDAGGDNEGVGGGEARESGCCCCCDDNEDTSSLSNPVSSCASSIAPPTSRRTGLLERWKLFPSLFLPTKAPLDNTGVDDPLGPLIALDLKTKEEATVLARITSNNRDGREHRFV